MGLDQISSTLDELIGYNVNLYISDETVKGKIIGVESDHVILENENQYVFYINFDKIQAITKNTKQFQEEQPTSEFLQTPSLVNLLSSLKDSWVTIVCLSKQQFNGILTSVDNNFASLISGEEKILIKLSNISNILKGYIKEDNKSDEETEQDISSNEVSSHVNTSDDTKYQDNSSVDSQFKNIEIPTDDHRNKVVKETHEKLTESLIEPEQAEKPVKVITNDIDKETKVWSQSIKSVNEPSQKGSNDSKPKFNSSIKNNSKEKESKQKVVNETNRVTQNVEKKTIQKSASEVKAVKETKAIKKQEPVSKGKEEVRDMPFVHPSIEKQNSHQVRNEDHKQKEASIPGSRFAGEPINLSEDERPSIFAGWPNRRNRPRF